MDPMHWQTMMCQEQAPAAAGQAVLLQKSVETAG